VTGLRLHTSISNPPKERAWSFDDVWEWKPVSTIKVQKTSDVSIIELPSIDSEGGATRAYRKRYWYPDLKSRLKGFFRNTFFGGSRAANEFKNLERLHAEGLSKIKPIAVGEDRLLRLLRRALILTESLPHTRNLEQFLNGETFTGLPLRERRSILCALGRWIARLHAREYRDRDLLARNILIHGAPGAVSFSKIDSAKGYGGRSPPAVRPPYLKDLRELDGDLRRALSRTERLRCLMAYLGTGKADGETRMLAERIGMGSGLESKT
jgi:hypothetical protein